MNTIGDEGTKKLSELLMINTTLTSLDLSGDDKIYGESLFVPSFQRTQR